MIDKYSSNEFNKVFVLQLSYTIQNKQNVECFRGRRVWTEQVNVVEILITILADLFLGIFEAFLVPFRMWTHFWNPLEMVRILFENPLWTSGEFGGFCVDSYYML